METFPLPLQFGTLITIQNCLARKVDVDCCLLRALLFVVVYARGISSRTRYLSRRRMAHTHCKGPVPVTKERVCIPLVPGPILYPGPSLSVVCTVKGIIYKPIVLGTVPGPVQYE